MKYFTEFFSNPKDIHRVFLSCVLALLFSHSIFLANSTASNLSIVHTKDYLLVSLFWFFVAFGFGFCLFSNKLTPKLFARMFFTVTWTIGIHRILMGVDQLGTAYFNFLALFVNTLFLPFAILGQSPDETLYMLGIGKKNSDEQDNVVEGKFHVNR